jgi:hypothetical protein
METLWNHNEVFSGYQFNNPEDEGRDGLRNVGLYKTEPPHPADSPRKMYYTHLPGKHQIVLWNQTQ